MIREQTRLFSDSFHQESLSIIKSSFRLLRYVALRVTRKMQLFRDAEKICAIDRRGILHGIGGGNIRLAAFRFTNLGEASCDESAASPHRRREEEYLFN